jgi:hypothetical protein
MSSAKSRYLECFIESHNISYNNNNNNNNNHQWHDSPLWALAFLRISEQFNFYGVRLSTSRSTPNLEDQGIPLRLAPTPNLCGLGGSTSSYATAGIALGVSDTLKPHYHDKVGIASLGTLYNTGLKMQQIVCCWIENRLALILACIYRMFL